MLTDAQSQLRQHPAAIGNIDQLLQHPKARNLLQEADRVLVFGGRLLSKRLIAYLAEQNWHSYWQVLPQQDRLDQAIMPNTFGTPTPRNLLNLIGIVLLRPIGPTP